ncbi:amidase [Sphingomonas morindae]
MDRARAPLLALALLLLPSAAPPPPAAPPIEERSLADLGGALARGETSSVAITAAYLARIAALDGQGPALHAIIALNPDAMAEARASDARRAAHATRGPLDGLPLLIKDNIETADPVATTAGSLALKDNISHVDAPVVARLRAAGAVILAKANLSEWANIRSTRALSGWSAMGGLVRNPYALDRTACGSSSGTGAGVAASFAAAGIGTETDGSVVCPSSINGLVGLKPSIGMVSRTRVVPISHSQDTPGPMARTVRDAALLFGAMVGPDPADPTTTAAAGRAQDFTAGLRADALRGRRVAVLTPATMTPAAAALFEAALATLRRCGAVPVPVARPDLKGLEEAEQIVLQTELKADLNAYLAATPAAVRTRSLAALIAFNQREAAREMPLFGQELFLAAEQTKGLDDPAYKAARADTLRRAAGALDGMLHQAGATILVTPTYEAAWLSDTVYGDQYDGPSASGLPAMAGYPHLTVPMGAVRGLPLGLSFIGPRFSEAALLNAGYAFEQAQHGRTAPRYRPTVESGAALDPAR